VLLLDAFFQISKQKDEWTAGARFLQYSRVFILYMKLRGVFKFIYLGRRRA
jgi:hypothetical protein